MDECDGADDDLLERARRLCLAAQAISASLPVLSSLRAASSGGAGGNGNQDEELTPSTQKSRDQPRNSAAGGKKPHSGKPKYDATNLSLPSAVVPTRTPAPAPFVTHKRALKKQKPDLGSTNQENLPEITISDEQRQLRDAEKIRHAQERARARISRTNQSDQLEAEREDEIRQQQLLRLEEVSAEKARLIEQSRLRAEERIRSKRQLQLAPIDKQQQVLICPEKPAPDLVKIERFRRKTLARLHALPRTPDGLATTKSVDPESSSDLSTADAESPERDEDLEAETRRQKEKKLRQETAERIRRLKAIAEEQRRYENGITMLCVCLLTLAALSVSPHTREEQDHIEQGLLRYKNRQKELDRVAKGLKPPRKPEAATTPVREIHSSSDGPQDKISVGTTDTQSRNEANDVPPGDDSFVEQEKHISRSGTPECEDSEPHEHNCLQLEDDPPPSLIIALDHQHAVPTLSSATSGGKRKLPPWKRAPVPMLPAEFYSCKAIIPTAPSTNPQSVSAIASNSYTEKFKSRVPSASSRSSTYSTSSSLSKLRAKPQSREAVSAFTTVGLGSTARDRAQ